jgi:PAS domain S-box-containing protein
MSTPLSHIKILQQIFEFSSQAILVLNTKMSITSSNLVAQELFGFNQNELENKFIETVIPELVKRIKSDTDQNITGLWILKKDGSQAFINLQLKRVANKQGFDTLLFLQDATDSLLYKWALKGSQNDLSNIESEGNLGNWYWVFDTDERYWSDEFYRICGLPPGDNCLSAETALNFIHPDDREMAIEVVTKTIEKHIPYNIEKRIVQPNGTVRNVIARGKVDYNAAGDPIRLSGTMKDITILKREQEALFESNRKYKTLINNLNGIVYSCENSLQYPMTYISEGCYAITGYTSDDFLNGTIHFGTIVLEEDRISTWNQVQEALSQKQHYDVAYRIASKEGTVKHLRERGCGVYANNGTYISLEGFITDETEQKEIQEILEIRNGALEVAGSGILIANALKPNLPIVYCNQTFTTITGYEKEEVLGKNCQFLQNDDKDQPQIKTMSIAIEQGEPCRVTLRNYRKDATLFWNDLSITPVKDKTDKTTHFIGVQNDITKQKKAVLLKDDIRDILELIAEDASLSVTANKIIETLESQIPNTATIISILNPKTNELQRLSESKLLKPLSKKLYESNPSGLKLLHPAFNAEKDSIITNILKHQDWKEHQDVMEATGLKRCWSFPVLSAQKHQLALLSIYTKDDHKLAAKLKETIIGFTKLLKLAIEKNYNRIGFIENEEQLEAYVHGLEEKVEERTKEVIATVEKLVATNLNLEDQIEVAEVAKKSADASKSLSTAIAKNFPNGFIIVIDANFELVLKEGQAIDELGLNKVIFEGMFVDDITIFSKEQKTKLKEDVLKTIQGEHLSFEMEYKKRYFAVNTTPLMDENNKISNALFVYNNISQQKKIEQRTQNALKKEQQLNGLKTQFISMASHEFRTPLSAIQTSAILIGKQNDSGKEEKREKYVGQIKNNVKQLVVILNDFLSLTKLEEGKVKANKVFFDLVDFSKKMIEEVSITAKKGQNILFSSSNTSLSFNLDPKLTRHILMNLLSNAIKYSPENSSINFTIKENEQSVVISIRDQGIGIPEAEQKNLFERFFRAKNAHNIEGTGLGLNIVQQYVALMDGSIHFKSETNKGTTFWIKFTKPTKKMKNEKSINHRR